MMRFPAARRTRPTIHLTALIDIVFLLLIFFLLTSRFVDQEGIPIALPQVGNEGEQILPDIVVKVDLNGIVYFNEQMVDTDGLFSLLSEQFEQAVTDTVIIQADGRARYDSVVQVMDTASQAGAKQLLLVTERAASGALGAP